MLGTALTVALAAAQLPGEVALPEELAGADVEVVIQATANHFAAENRSALEQVLLFGSADAGARVAVRLAPGARVVYPFPRGSVDDLLVEVVALDPPRWRNSGALPIGLVRASSAGALWIQAAGERSVGWTTGPEGLRHAVPTAELLPRRLIRAQRGLHDFRTAAAHVPVPLPRNDLEGSKPPVLDKKPLPPV